MLIPTEINVGRKLASVKLVLNQFVRCQSLLKLTIFIPLQ